MVLALAAAAGGAALVLADGEDATHQSARDRWSPLRPARLGRTEVAAARVGRHIDVAGGFEQRSGASTAALERYDIERDRWSRRRAMPIALNHPAAAAYQGHVYVLGGYTGR